MTTSRITLSGSIILALAILGPAGARPLSAQDAAPAASKDGVTQTPPTVEVPDPLKRPLSDKQKLAQRKMLKQELSDADKKWLNEDVYWIITDQEKEAFKHLSNAEERENFIENFWLRRNPSPDSPDNEFRDEHYRRIAYANEHFAAGKPGWKTDRG
ncbi:MAG: GWxTD domain-containing protein, partial [Acidobacteriaceae bacterium]|nr:GWxTD domain-containing protein [Acidobacteriaceae bacterium]